MRRVAIRPRTDFADDMKLLRTLSGCVRLVINGRVQMQNDCQRTHVLLYARLLAGALITANPFLKSELDSVEGDVEPVPTVSDCELETLQPVPERWVRHRKQR